eukprot:jgi/Phyca11/511681/fgenesh2_kg.PHYCAscaffold_95_\
MKRENESEQYVSSGLRQPMSYVTTDRPRDYSSDDNDLAAPGSDGFGTMPPPAPQSDVYSRLAGQYTASAKSKRHHGAAPARREKGDDMNTLEKADEAYVEQHGDEDANYTGSEDESNYDPLLGGESLIKQVHDDYQERLAQRNTDAG